MLCSSSCEYHTEDMGQECTVCMACLSQSTLINAQTTHKMTNIQQQKILPGLWMQKSKKESGWAHNPAEKRLKQQMGHINLKPVRQLFLVLVCLSFLEVIFQGQDRQNTGLSIPTQALQLLQAGPTLNKNHFAITALCNHNYKLQWQT